MPAPGNSFFGRGRRKSFRRSLWPRSVATTTVIHPTQYIRSERISADKSDGGRGAFCQPTHRPTRLRPAAPTSTQPHSFFSSVICCNSPFRGAAICATCQALRGFAGGIQTFTFANLLENSIKQYSTKSAKSQCYAKKGPFGPFFASKDILLYSESFLQFLLTLNTH